jgi:GNAT superfamily N-acetyltransferase
VTSAAGDPHVVRVPSDAPAGPRTSTGPAIEWRREPYLVSTDPARLDIAATTAFLTTSPWAPDISEETVRRSIEHSVAFGLYEGAVQVGFARVVTDRATFAWVGDVFVLETHRGRGLGLWLMRCVQDHPELQELRRWVLTSSTARDLYARLGYRALAAPQNYMEITDPGVHRRQRERVRRPAADPEA